MNKKSTKIKKYYWITYQVAYDGQNVGIPVNGVIDYHPCDFGLSGAKIIILDWKEISKIDYALLKARFQHF